MSARPAQSSLRGETNRTKRWVRGLLAGALAFLGLLVLADVGYSRPGTTAPAPSTHIRVTITNTKIAVSNGATAARGTWMHLTIVNRSKWTASFSFLGKTREAIGPNEVARLAIFALRRGVFALSSSLQGARQLHGTFVVF